MLNEIEPESKNGLLTMLGVAVIGGAARQMHQILSGKKVTWQHFIMRAVISTFIGLICYFALPQGTPWTSAICGLLSWLGADGVALLLQLVVKKDDSNK